MSRLVLFGALAAAAVFAAPAAWSETLHYKAHLTGAAETPPNDSPGMGEASVAYDTGTKLLIWSVDYHGLTGPATMAHFHGPAPVGKAAGVVLVLAPPDSPIKGSAVLTDAQAAELKDGLLYINVHTAAHPGGEIRGQVEAAH
jgi:hypothetical protein